MNKRIYELSKFPLITGLSLIVALILLLAGCNSRKRAETEAGQKNPKCKVETSFFGMTAEGDSAKLYTLTNEKDIEITISNYG